MLLLLLQRSCSSSSSSRKNSSHVPLIPGQIPPNKAPIVDSETWDLVGKGSELSAIPLKRKRTKSVNNNNSNNHSNPRASSPNKKILPKHSTSSSNNTNSIDNNNTNKAIITTGNYQIRHEDLITMMILGAGTYGEVKSGYYGKRKVAIKELFKAKNEKEEEEIISDFKREVEILKCLNHPKIVSFVGFVDEVNKPRTLVFEFCEGNVAQLLRAVRHGIYQLSFRLLLNIAQDCAEAVHYLHKQRPPIIHRDLKAENLLLTRDWTCKLTDYGLSRSFDPSQPSVMTVCGTPCWVAPEVFRGEPYNEKIDVYSFSITLWEIFSAKKPFQDKDCSELPVLVTQHGLRPPILHNVPQELNQLMVDCWNDTATSRPSFGIIRRRLDKIYKEVMEMNKLGKPVHTQENFYHYSNLS
jgi:hypothetical protein